MRCAPEAFGFATRGFQQLQLLVTLSSQHLTDSTGVATTAFLRSRVLVYWTDSASWFAGFVTSVDAASRALQVEYEDGDVRWEQVQWLLRYPGLLCYCRPSLNRFMITTHAPLLTPGARLYKHPRACADSDKQS